MPVVRSARYRLGLHRISFSPVNVPTTPPRGVVLPSMLPRKTDDPGEQLPIFKDCG
jgi:hypothetical protein